MLTSDMHWLPALTDPRPLAAPAPAVLATLPVDARALADGFLPACMQQCSRVCIQGCLVVGGTDS